MTTESRDDIEPAQRRAEPEPESQPDSPTESKLAPSTAAEPPGPSRTRRLVEVAVVTAVVLALDLWSKAWAWDNLRDGQVVTVIENWFYYEFGFNTGSAFSFLKDASYARATFIGVTIVALAYMGRLATTLPTRFGTAFVAVACVSGGALGNLHDRLFRVMEIRGEARHGVVDFIKVYYWPDKVWPTFNVADIALVVGVGLLFIFLTRHGDALDPPKDSAKKDETKAA
jgi:signal peptidase II